MPYSDRPSHRFDLGRLTITPGALAKLSRLDIVRAFARHSRCDWGDLCASDKAANEAAIANECRVLSAYHSPQGVKHYVITEADRSYTTLLFPSEY